MNQDEWIYLSYDNHKLEFALKLGRDLASKGFGIWLDRLSVAPDISWAEALIDRQNKSQAAIVLLNSAYFNSEYCKQELNLLQKQNARLIALCLDTDALEKILQNPKFTAVLDFRHHQDEANYQTCLENLEASLSKLGFFAAFIPEERVYLLKLIASLELALSQTITGRLAMRNTSGTDWQGRKLRPRCHAPAAWLNHGQFGLFEASLGAKDTQASHLVLSNIFEWLEWRSRMMIVGEAGTGKTTLLQYICLVSAFRRLENGINVPLPFYLELAERQEQESILSFIEKRWPLNNNIVELLQRGAIMLFVDGLGESVYTNELSHQDIVGLLDIETISSVIVSAREDAIDFDLPSDLSIIEIGKLQETQMALIMDGISLQNDVAPKPCHIETLASRLLSNAVLSEAPERKSQQHLQYLIPALWKEFGKEGNSRFTLTDLTRGLETFACQTYELGQATYYPHQIVLQSMGNDLLILLALDLGILECRANRFRFVSSNLCLYLAANKVLVDGVYHYLQHPRFAADGQRLAQPWDKLIFFATQLMATDDIPLFIQSIADVDPYLAFEVAQYQSSFLSATLRDIISKLLEPRRSALRSLSLSKQIIAAIPDKDTLATILIEAMQASDWSKREIAFELARDLPMPEADTAEVVALLETIEPNFPDSVYSVLEAVSDAKSCFLLCQLAINGNLSQRIKAIEVLGELSQPIGAIVLSQLSLEEASSVLIPAARALARIKDKRTLAFVYALLLHADRHVIQAAESSLVQIDSGLKTTVFLFLSQENALSQTLSKTLLSISDEVLRQILVYILGNLGYGYSHSIDLERMSEGSGDMVRRLLDLLSSKMASLSSREAFQDFADEMLNRAGIYRDEEAMQETQRSQLAKRVRVQKPVAPKIELSHAEASAIPQRLIAGLKNEDWLIRIQSLEQVAAYPSALSLNLLLEAAKDSDAQIRIAALKAVPDPEENPMVLEALLSALDDSDYQVIDAAAERLRTTEAAIIPGLLKKLHGVSDYGLASVIELLGQKGDETVVASLADFIDDVREPWMWHHCIGDITVQALLTIGSPEAIQLVQESGRIAYPVLNDIILPGSDDEGHGEAPSSFDAFRALLRELHSESWQVSQQAARQMRETAKSLRGQDNGALAEMLSESLSDSNWVVRWTVLETLAWLQASSTLPQLILMLEDENWMVKIASIHALVELKATTASRQIEALLFHSNTAVREAAAEALGEFCSADSFPALAQALNDSDQFVRLAVLQAIIRINDKAQSGLLLEALGDSYSHIRWHAIRALSQTAEPGYIRSIVPLLRDMGKPAGEKYSISNYAELALRRMGSAASRQVLEKWAKVKGMSK